MIAPALVALVLVGCKGEDGAKGKDGEPGEPGAPGTGSNAQIIEADTTWSDIQIISGILYVQPGVTLTIEAGTMLELLPAAGVFVDGTIISQGSAVEPVQFNALTTVGLPPFGVFVGGSGDASSLDHTSWDFVDLVVQGGGMATLANATFDDASLEVRDRTAEFTLSDADFSGSDGASDCAFFLDVPTVTVSGSAFEGCDDGVYIAGASDVTGNVSGSTFSNLSSSAVQFFGDETYDNLLSVDAVTIDGTSAAGIDIRAANATVTNATITNADGVGIWGDSDSTLTVSLSEITDASNNCIDGDGDGLTVTHSTLTNCGDDALEGEADVTVTHVTISGAEDDGIDVLDGTISNCKVTGSGDAGISIYDGLATSISDCEIADNGGYGIAGSTTLDNAVDVTSNNITGNWLQGVSVVRVVDGNYIADNHGQLGADLLTGGALDGQHDFVSPQILNADQVTNAQAGPVSGVGP